MKPVPESWLSAFLDHELPAAKSTRVRAWLESSPGAQQQADSWNRVCRALSDSVPAPISVPPGFRKKILERVSQTGPRTPGTSTGWSIGSYWLAGALLVGMLGGLALWEYSRPIPSRPRTGLLKPAEPLFKPGRRLPAERMEMQKMASALPRAAKSSKVISNSASEKIGRSAGIKRTPWVLGGAVVPRALAANPPGNSVTAQKLHQP